MTIVDGFRRACAAAVEALEGRAFDNAADAAALREDLLAIARTTLSSKILTHDKDHFASIAVDAVMCLKGRTNLEPIHIIKKAGGTMHDSFLAEVCPLRALELLINVNVNNSLARDDALCTKNFLVIDSLQWLVSIIRRHLVEYVDRRVSTGPVFILYASNWCCRIWHAFTADAQHRIGNKTAVHLVFVSSRLCSALDALCPASYGLVCYTWILVAWLLDCMVCIQDHICVTCFALSWVGSEVVVCLCRDSFLTRRLEWARSQRSKMPRSWWPTLRWTQTRSKCMVHV